MSAASRFQALDGLRFLAFSPIFFLHACGGNVFYQLALTALDLFFLLSGFLTGFGRFEHFYTRPKKNHNTFINNTIVGISNKTNNNNHIGSYSLWIYTIRYMIKKIQIFYPWHVFCLLWSICIFCYAPHSAGFMPHGVDEWLWKTPAYLLMVQSWWISPEIKFCFNGVSWFLASLMFCYAVSPLILKGMSCALRRRGKISIILIGLSALLIKTIPYVVEIDGSLSEDFTKMFDRNVHSWPLLRLMDYTVGMCAGILFMQQSKISSDAIAPRLQLTVQIVLAVMIVVGSFLIPAPLTLLLCTFWVYLTVKWSDTLLSKVMSSRVLVFLGGLVMPVYLTHNLVLKSMRVLDIRYGNLMYACIVFVFCFMLAWGIMWLLRQVRNLRIKNELISSNEKSRNTM